MANQDRVKFSSLDDLSWLAELPMLLSRHSGLGLQSVSLSDGQAVSWSPDEVEGIINVRIAGKSDDKFKALVEALDQARHANS